MARYPFFLKIVRHVFILFLLFAVLPLWGQFKYVPKTPSRLYIPYREGNLWGYCDTLGQVLLSPRYDSVGFYDGWYCEGAVFKQDGLYGVLDYDFEEIITGYDASPGLPVKNDRYAIVTKNSRVGVVNTDNLAFIPIEFDSVSFEYLDFWNIVTRQNGKFGLYGRYGELRATPQFDEVLPAYYFQEVYKLAGMVGRKKDTWYHIGPDGKQTVYTALTRRDSRQPVADKKQFDATHTDKISPAEKRQLESLEPELKSKYGISKILYNRVVGFSGGRYEYVLVQKNKQVALLYVDSGNIHSDFFDDIMGVIGNGSEEVIEVMEGEKVEQNLHTKYPSEVLLVRKGKKYGMVSPQGQEVLPFVYDGFSEISDQTIVTHQKNKKGIINLLTHYPPLPCRYDDIRYHKGLPVNKVWNFEIYQVSTNGRRGYVGKNGVEYFKNQ